MKMRQALLLAGAATTILIGSGIVWGIRVVDDRWQAAVASMDPLEERFAAEKIERQALWGETTIGLAQPHYDRALSLVHDWNTRAVLAARWAEGEEGKRQRQLFAEKGAAALDAVRLGAHANNATRAVDWSRGFQLPLRTLVHTRLLTHLAEMQAEQLIANGQEVEAVRTLLDVLQLAGDMAEGPILIEEMIGLSQLNPDFLIDGTADGSLNELSQEAREELVHGLSTLNQRLPWKGSGTDGDFLLAVHGLESALQHGGTGWLTMTGNSGWIPLERTLGRILTTAYVQETHKLSAELDRAFDSGASALANKTKELSARYAASRNPISSTLMPKIDSYCRGRFYSLGRFRLVAAALTGDVPADDSWTTDHLRVDAAESGERYWLDHELFPNVEVLVAR